jgi:hypothetical protein
MCPPGTTEGYTTERLTSLKVASRTFATVGPRNIRIYESVYHLLLCVSQWLSTLTRISVRMSRHQFPLYSFMVAIASAVDCENSTITHASSETTSGR